MDTATPNAEDGFDLDPVEVRVLGVLIEKAFITPDSYPLSINALTAGCNQLTAREPVMALGERDVQDAIDRLSARRLVTKRDQSGARVAKYEHQVRLRYSLPPPEQAVLSTLLLRGAQTPGEIRSRCERLHRFDDTQAIEAVLEHLSDKFPPMVAALPRAPGTKETRYMHLMGGHAALQEAIEAQSAVANGGGSRGRNAELEDEVRRLREELEALKLDFAAFRRQFE